MSANNTYDIGDSVKSSVSFKTCTGVSIDPTVVTVMYKVGTGSVTTKVYGTDSEVVKDSVGNYHINLTATEGIWYVRWTGTGSVVAAAEDQYTVTASLVV